MKRAIVLGGGGSRGSYQLGAYRALKELGIDFQMAVGTSIGAINAAFIAQGDFALHEQLWNTITIDQVMRGGINLYENIEDYFDQKLNVASFMKIYAQNRGADITPLIDIIKANISEERVRSSCMETGFVTVRFPAFTPLEVMLPDIPEGMLIDYIIASASVFPAFPVHKIGDQGYIDGGYYDTLPVNHALDHGATEIVCVDLTYSLTHPHMTDKPFITYIHPSQRLGSILMFEREILDRNRDLGYRDAMRAYGKVAGIHYSFDAESMKKHKSAATRFSLTVARLEGLTAYKNAFNAIRTPTPLSDELKKYCDKSFCPQSACEFIIAAEMCAGMYNIDPFRQYTMKEFNDTLRENLPIAEAEALRNKYGDFSASDVIPLLKSLDRRLLPLLWVQTLTSKPMRAVLPTLAALYPTELLCSVYLRLMLPELHRNNS